MQVVTGKQFQCHVVAFVELSAQKPSLDHHRSQIHDLHQQQTTSPHLLRVSRYQKGKTSLDLNEARDDGPYANDLHLASDR